MEDASKALIIAGGILFALIVTGMFVYMWLNSGNFMVAQNDEKSVQQLAAFNKQYESYQKQIMRGADVASAINKVRDNNNKNVDNPELAIKWQFTLKNALIVNSVQVLAATTYKSDNQDANSGSQYNVMIADEAKLKEFKRLYFKCTKIGYSSATGRVNSIEFIEVPASDIFN